MEFLGALPRSDRSGPPAHPRANSWNKLRVSEVRCVPHLQHPSAPVEASVLTPVGFDIESSRLANAFVGHQHRGAHHHVLGPAYRCMHAAQPARMASPNVSSGSKQLGPRLVLVACGLARICCRQRRGVSKMSRRWRRGARGRVVRGLYLSLLFSLLGGCLPASVVSQ